MISSTYAPKDLFLLPNGHITTGHMSEEKQKSVYNCEIQE